MNKMKLTKDLSFIDFIVKVVKEPRICVIKARQ